VANASETKVRGEFTVPFKVGDAIRVIQVLYVPALSTDLLLGIDFWRKFNLKPDFVERTCEVGSVTLDLDQSSMSGEAEAKPDDDSVLTTAQRQELEEILRPYRPHFAEGKLGCAKGIFHHINTGNAPPFKQRYNSLNPRLMEEAHAELDRRLALNLVEPSDSPYCSPLLRLAKKGGGARWVVDLRQLNNQIICPNAHQLPKINGLLMNTRGAAIISSLDIKDAYLQIPLDEESRKKTAFYVPQRGLFQFTRMPAGLKDAAGRWQNYIERLLGYDPNVLVYMDDILIFSPEGEWQHHKALLRRVLDKLVEAGVTVNLKKSVFGRRKTLYLGHVIDRHGIRPDPKNIAAVVNFPRPSTAKQVRQFLGLAGWMRKFVPAFSTVARPLTNLTKKDRKFAWGEPEERAFIELKERLCSNPILYSPDFSKSFRVYTDASALGTGGILAQEIDGHERVIAYTSRALTATEEKNLSATELEVLAVLHALEAFRPYLEGYKFQLFTDHSSLKWLVQLKNPKGRLARWAVELQAYEFEVMHRAGTSMQAPDALSRNPISVDLIDLPLLIVDEWYNSLCEKVDTEPENYEQFRKHDDMLLKLISVGRESPLRWVQCLPEVSRRRALQDCHDSPTSGHAGHFKTFQRLRQLYYWPKMEEDCKAYVRSCRICQEQKVDRRKPPGLMGSSRKVTRPFELLCSDFVGPLPRSRKGYNNLLVCVDYFSKYVFLKPTRNAKAKTLCDTLENEIFLVYGCPRTICVDSGPAYKSKELKALCAKYNVTIGKNIYYMPRNNPTERYNQTVETMLRSYIESNQRTWDERIPEIQAALRSAVNEVTKFTPQFLVFGSELVLDGRMHLYDGERREQGDVECADRAEFSEEFKKRDAIFAEVAVRMKEASERNQRYHNRRRREFSLKEGDLVLRRNFTLSDAAEGYAAKLAPRWRGPYTVKKRLGNVSYLLHDEKGVEDGPWHVEQLKKFVTESCREPRVDEVDAVARVCEERVLEDEKFSRRGDVTML